MKGVLHPLTLISRVAIAALGDMGFEIVEAPEVDTAWYNFDSLRIGETHPARLGHPSFWLSDGRLLRTHTTNMQLHITQLRKPPLRVAHIGQCYRDDATDTTHDVAFMQLDGLVLDEEVSLANLLAVLEAFIHRVIGPETKYRFRPHVFPFTEPSVEIDVWHNNRWIELLGSGMVHPEVMKAMKLDPSKMRGFAFGIGLERIALIKWGIEDIRLLRQNRINFLRQWKLS